MRLHHVSIPVPPDKLSAGRDFYAKAFGMEEVTPPESLGENRVVWFRLGDCELHLFIEDGSGADSGGRHFAVEVDDLDGARRRLEEQNVSVEDAVPIHNRPRFFCHDPYGNRIEVTRIVGPYR